MTGPDISRAICASFKERPFFCQASVFDKLVGKNESYTKNVI